MTIFHTHTQESATVTFRRGGSYVTEGLNQLNHLLRDWRVEQSTNMDPRLFDIIWEVHRAVGSRAPVHIISAYRSPQTNQALRSRSRAVSDQSQHMLGKAMDIRFPDVDAARVREAAMRLQDGGVGFYPGANFVHVDVGSVRAWPRMTREQLSRLFPDGRTVHLPSDGDPLPGYEQARAEILSRGSTSSREAGLQRRTPWAGLVDKGKPAPSQATVEPGSASHRLAYVAVPLPRSPLWDPASAGASNTNSAPDLASARLVFSTPLSAAWPEPGARVLTVKVSANPFPIDPGFIYPTASPVPSQPQLDPDMEKAKSNLRRALAERARAFYEQHTSAITGSMPASLH